MKILWGHREGGYSLTIRQVKGVRGYQINFYPKDNAWGVIIGHARTKKECKVIIQQHMSGVQK